MVFASTELARRVEAAERGLIEECTAAVARRTGSAGAFSMAIGGGIAAFSGTDSPLTKVAGLGFAGVPAVGELERVEAEFAARGASVQVELCALARAGIGELLTRRGYVLVGFENVLGRALDARTVWPERAGLELARCGDEELEAWIDVVVSAFAALDAQGVASHESFPREALERAIRDMTGARGCVRYLARRAGALAGAASMRIADGVAQLCGAGTLPEHRRRGVQGALLERRLADAAREGCDLAVVTTLPGSKSQENVQKRGFELLYTRAILRRGS
jgi:ribosomal protein S18 acetylase RimI-like enzyme